MKLNAKQLRDVDEVTIQDDVKNIKRRPVYFILENIYDTYNVGGLFRLADAIGVSKMYLCGEMEIPPNSRIKKASIGTYKVVNWEYKKTAKEAIQEMQQINSKQITDNEKIKIIAIEQDRKSKDYRTIDMKLPVCFVVGNETSGVTQETLKLCDEIAEIPMWGVNKSLNVIVSAAIVSYYATSFLPEP